MSFLCKDWQSGSDWRWQRCTTCRPNSSNESAVLFRRLLWTEEITQLSDAAVQQEPCISDLPVFYGPQKHPPSWDDVFQGSICTFGTLASSANNLWSSAVRRGSAPQFKCQKVCILANCLVKGQPVSDNETHGGRSLEVLRAAGAYKSCPGDGQRLFPPGMVYEGCSWQLFREQNNAVKTASFFFLPTPHFPAVGCKEIR